MRYASRGLSLAVVLLFSVSILSVFVAAQDVQNNHPTEEQPYMYFWGEEDLFECWNNFDSNALQVHRVLVMVRLISPKDRM